MFERICVPNLPAGSVFSRGRKTVNFRIYFFVCTPDTLKKLS
jgi:hypothetical protein